jgi:hypothetical protein
MILEVYKIYTCLKGFKRKFQVSFFFLIFLIKNRLLTFLGG